MLGCHQTFITLITVFYCLWRWKLMMMVVVERWSWWYVVMCWCVDVVICWCCIMCGQSPPSWLLEASQPGLRSILPGGLRWGEERRTRQLTAGNVSGGEHQPQSGRAGPEHAGEVSGGHTEERCGLWCGREVLLQSGPDLENSDDKATLWYLTTGRLLSAGSSPTSRPPLTSTGSSLTTPLTWDLSPQVRHRSCNEDKQRTDTARLVWSG